MYRKSFLVLACASLAACATPPEKIQAREVNAEIYDPYDCAQLKVETIRVDGRLQTIVGMQSKQASSDRMVTGAGILFSPALAAVMLVASKDLKQEVAELKGEHDALSKATLAKNCIA